MITKLWVYWAIGLALALGGSSVGDDEPGQRKSAPRPCISENGLEEGVCYGNAYVCESLKGRIIGKCERQNSVCCLRVRTKPTLRKRIQRENYGPITELEEVGHRSRVERSIYVNGRQCTFVSGTIRLGGQCNPLTQTICYNSKKFYAGLLKESLSFNCHCCLTPISGVTSIHGISIPLAHRCEVVDRNGLIANGACTHGIKICEQLYGGVYLKFRSINNCYCCVSKRDLNPAFVIEPDSHPDKTIYMLGAKRGISDLCVHKESNTLGYCETNVDHCITWNNGIVLNKAGSLTDNSPCVCCSDPKYVYKGGFYRDPSKPAPQPQPQTPRPPPQTPRPQPHTPRPQPQTPRPQPQSPRPQPQTPRPPPPKTPAPPKPTPPPFPVGGVQCRDRETIQVSDCGRIFGQTAQVTAGQASYHQCRFDFVNIPRVCGIQLTLNAELKDCDENLAIGFYFYKQNRRDPNHPERINLCEKKYKKWDKVTLSDTEHVNFWIVVTGYDIYGFDVTASFLCCDGTIGSYCCDNANAIHTTTSTSKATTTTTSKTTSTESPVPESATLCRHEEIILISKCGRTFGYSEGILPGSTSYHKCQINFVDISNICGIQLTLNTGFEDCTEVVGSGFYLAKDDRSKPGDTVTKHLCDGIKKAGDIITLSDTEHVNFWITITGYVKYDFNTSFICCDGAVGEECCERANTVIPTVLIVPTVTSTCNSAETQTHSTCIRLHGDSTSRSTSCSSVFDNVPNICGLIASLNSPLDVDCRAPNLIIIGYEVVDGPEKGDGNSINLCGWRSKNGSRKVIAYPHKDMAKFYVVVNGKFNYNIDINFLCCSGEDCSEYCKEKPLPTPVVTKTCDAGLAQSYPHCLRITGDTNTQLAVCSYHFHPVPNICGLVATINSPLEKDCVHPNSILLQYKVREGDKVVDKKSINLCTKDSKIGKTVSISHSEHGKAEFQVGVYGHTAKIVYDMSIHFLCCPELDCEDYCKEAFQVNTTPLPITTTQEPLEPHDCESTYLINFRKCGRIQGNRLHGIEGCSYNIFPLFETTCKIQITLLTDPECDPDDDEGINIQSSEDEEKNPRYLCQFKKGHQELVPFEQINGKFSFMRLNINGAFSYDLEIQMICCGEAGDKVCCESPGHECEANELVNVRSCRKLQGSKVHGIKSCTYNIHPVSEKTCKVQITFLSDPECDPDDDEGIYIRDSEDENEDDNFCQFKKGHRALVPFKLEKNGKFSFMRLFIDGPFSYDLEIQMICCEDDGDKVCCGANNENPMEQRNNAKGLLNPSSSQMKARKSKNPATNIGAFMKLIQGGY